jgi:hypothetical protein
MLPEIEVGQSDDPCFIVLANSLVRGLVKRESPEALWLIKIDNRFDHKWLRFSGIGCVDFKFPAYMNQFDAALDEFYQERVTFPPFTPNRVVGQWSFVRTGDHYVEMPLAVPHRSEKQPSEMNLQRRVHDFSRCACFLWYSANTVANGRGSLMVYDLVGERTECWFAAFTRRSEWKLLTTKGIRRAAVEDLLGGSP